jgi:DNA polymerase-3 subunit epsilon
MGVRTVEPLEGVSRQCVCGERVPYRRQEDRAHAHARAREDGPLGLGLVLDRPLVVMDFETTGIDTREARIVEFCFLRIGPGGRQVTWASLVNPTIPIPPEATAIHGITNDDVAIHPTFAQRAAEVLEFLSGCDLAGFNIRSYDLRVLLAELARAGHTLDLAGLRLVDALSIYHKREPRNLTAAVRLYCGRDHAEAHGALGDVRATLEVLAAQLARYPDLPRSVGELHTMFAPEGALDLEGRFRRGPDGEARFTFGKYMGESLALIARDKPDYLRWMLGQDFLPDTKAIIRSAL